MTIGWGMNDGDEPHTHVDMTGNIRSGHSKAGVKQKKAKGDGASGRTERGKANAVIDLSNYIEISAVSS